MARKKKADTAGTTLVEQKPVSALPMEADAPPPRGLEDVEREDMVIPRFAIVQPSTHEEGTHGTIRDAISGEEHATLENVVLLKLRKGRVWFAGEDDPGEGVLCASDDRVKPAARIEKPVQESCAGCPMAQWRVIAGKRKHPKCQETYTLLIAADGMPYFITFKSAAMKDVKKLLTQLRLKAGKERVDAFAFCFTISTELEKFSLGQAYMPRFSNIKRVSADDYALYGALYEAFAEQEPTFDDKPPEADAAAEANSQGDFPFGENA